LAKIKVRKDVSDKSLFFEHLTLSDISVVKLLIEYRYKYDIYLYSENNNFFNVAGEIQTMNEELILTYVDLDKTIVQCDFSLDQLKMIGLYGHGFTIREMATELGLGSYTHIKKKFNTICNQIVKQNLWNWRKTHYLHELGLRSKKCSKCKSSLPATDEFFSPSNQTTDGFFRYCKKCR
jgi:hypothetical protein